MGHFNDEIYFPQSVDESEKEKHEHLIKLTNQEIAFLNAIKSRNISEIIVLRHNIYDANDWRFEKNNKYIIIDVLGICLAGGTKKYTDQNNFGCWGIPKAHGWDFEHNIITDELKAIVQAFEQTNNYFPYLPNVKECAQKLGYNLVPEHWYLENDFSLVVKS